MRRIYKEDMLLLTPGTEILRILPPTDFRKYMRTYMTITKGPYRRYVKTFGREWDFVEVKGYLDYPEGHEYFISDLFNGEVYILNKYDTTGDEEEPEYVTDEDLEIEI